MSNENRGKYRGKRVDNGEWVYGYYLRGRLNNRKTGRKPYHHEYDNIVAHYICPVKKRWGDVYFDEACNDIPVEVHPDTVKQYTGQKDKNDVEIYRGEQIMVTWDDGETMVYTVDWSDELWGYCLDSGAEMPPSSQIEVIGTIHDKEPNHE